MKKRHYIAIILLSLLLLAVTIFALISDSPISPKEYTLADLKPWLEMHWERLICTFG